MGREIEAGRVWTNCYNLYPAHAAFGGYKQSGIGRENHKMALSHYQQTKCLLVSYNPERPSASSDPGVFLIGRRTKTMARLVYHEGEREAHRRFGGRGRGGGDLGHGHRPLSLGSAPFHRGPVHRLRHHRRRHRPSGHGLQGATGRHAGGNRR